MHRVLVATLPTKFEIKSMSMINSTQLRFEWGEPTHMERGCTILTNI
jgi:hypothetical protein